MKISYNKSWVFVALRTATFPTAAKDFDEISKSWTFFLVFLASEYSINLIATPVDLITTNQGSHGFV